MRKNKVYRSRVQNKRNLKLKYNIHTKINQQTSETKCYTSNKNKKKTLGRVKKIFF